MSDDLPKIASWKWRLWTDLSLVNGTRVFLFGETADGRQACFKLQAEFIGTRHGPSPQLMEPLADTELRAFLQPLVDEAARHGILPGNLEHTLAAQGRHLEDMRALAFGRAKPEASR